MQPEPVPVPLVEKPDLWAMFQLYGAELAPHAIVKPVNGILPYSPFDLYWQEDKRWPFWAMIDGQRVGFALVRFAPEHNAMQMAEFYILPDQRRGGTGLAFARSLLTRFPGPWKMREIVTNKGAVAFWRRVVEPYGFSEESYTDKGIARIEQTLMVG